MEFLNTLFGDRALTKTEFEAALKSHSEIKLVNLSDGNYVAKAKYDNDLRAKDASIQTLTNTVAERDKALGELKTQLENAGTDAQLLSELKTKVTTLETQAATDKQNYEAALHKEKNKGACKDFASGLKFKSKADKEHFINFMIAKNLEMDGDKLIGANDCLESYKADYADSFVAEEKPKEPDNPFIDRRKPNPPAPTFNLTELMKK